MNSYTMSGENIIVVFRATGIQGGSVVKSLLGNSAMAAEFSVRAVTSDVSKPAAKALLSKGVEVVSVSIENL